MTKVEAWLNRYIGVGTLDVAILSVLYGIAYLIPLTDFTYPVGKVITGFAPAWTWGAIWVGAGLMRIFATTSRHYNIAIFALALLTPLWVFVTVITIYTRAPVIAVYTYILLKILWSFMNWAHRA